VLFFLQYTGQLHERHDELRVSLIVFINVPHCCVGVLRICLPLVCSQQKQLVERLVPLP
jgi:hypothetical protein